MSTPQWFAEFERQEAMKRDRIDRAHTAIIDGRPSQPSRSDAFEAFLAAICEAIPEAGGDWPTRRALVRDAGREYAHAAVREAISPTVAPESKRGDIALDTQIYGSVGDER